MKAFTFERVAAAEDAARAVAARTGAMYLAGGTTLVDLMNIDVLTPDTVVDVRPLGLSRIDVSDDGKTVGSAVSYHTASARSGRRWTLELRCPGVTTQYFSSPHWVTWRITQQTAASAAVNRRRVGGPLRASPFAISC